MIMTYGRIEKRPWFVITSLQNLAVPVEFAVLYCQDHEKVFNTFFITSCFDLPYKKFVFVGSLGNRTILCRGPGSDRSVAQIG